MTTLPETVQEYSIHAAHSFIQTAVFVDDRIYERGSASANEPKKVVVPKSRKRVSRSASVESGEDTVSVEIVTEEDPAPDSYDIVNSFAKKQIVCSLYQPKKTAKVSPASDIFPLCRAADVVIVDWDLFGDKGQRALELIDGLISQAVWDVPEQLRLILVYTQEANLFGVANDIYEKVHPGVGDSFKPLEEEDGLAFHTENSRIAVLGKPGRERADTDPRHIVDESDLADITVREFAKLASGILQAATLLGLAEIRKNSRKILSRFNSDLDSAFLTHLAMCLPEEDASSHVIPLLVSEIEAVLEDALSSPLMPENLIKDWCKDVWEPGDHLANILGDGNNYRAIGEAILTDGFSGARSVHTCIPKISSNGNIRNASKIFLKSADDNANHRFAHLMSSRTFYGGAPKNLTLGTIVFDEKNKRYLLCLQPVCDSVRIKCKRSFLFVEFDTTVGTGNNAATHAVVKSGGDVLELFYQSKSYRSVISTFRPTMGKDQVMATIEENEPPTFVDTSEENYRWIDQLKTAHAQRAVEHFASDLSRVGLTESEWLRLLKKK